MTGKQILNRTHVSNSCNYILILIHLIPYIDFTGVQYELKSFTYEVSSNILVLFDLKTRNILHLIEMQGADKGLIFEPPTNSIISKFTAWIRSPRKGIHCIDRKFRMKNYG